MKILVVNAGSSSLKYQLIDMDNEKVIAKGLVERIGQKLSVVNSKYGTESKTYEAELKDHTAAIKVVLDSLVGPGAPLKSMSEIGGVGHRVVHSGERFSSSVRIDKPVISAIEAISDLAPLHNPANLEGIKACMSVMPTTPAVAVFDTSFHSTMPAYAYMYAVPYELYTKYQVRKYGFHGTSHQYVSGEATRMLGKNDGKVIICHLGNGASVSAVDSGVCKDTSMGLTPLEGLVMGTRSGDIDAGAIEYLVGKTGKGVSEIISMLNKQSGVLGVSGLSSDLRDVLKAEDEGNANAKLALDMVCYRVRKYIGSYAAALGGVDAVAFTAGIGENSCKIRERICTGLEFLGVKVDKQKNDNAPYGACVDISDSSAKVRILVIPTNEELVIARETLKYGFGK